MSLTELGLGGFKSEWKERREGRWRQKTVGMTVGEVCEKIVLVQCKVCAKH